MYYEYRNPNDSVKFSEVHPTTAALIKNVGLSTIAAISVLAVIFFIFFPPTAIITANTIAAASVIIDLSILVGTAIGYMNLRYQQHLNIKQGVLNFFHSIGEKFIQLKNALFPSRYEIIENNENEIELQEETSFVSSSLQKVSKSSSSDSDREEQFNFEKDEKQFSSVLVVADESEEEKEELLIKKGKIEKTVEELDEELKTVYSKKASD